MSARTSRVVALAASTMVWLVASSALGDPPAVPTVQRRFARKVGTLGVHAIGTATFRGDFYEHAGGGASLAYYPLEELGIELRALGYGAWLSAAAEQLREDTGFVPDTRARIGSVLLSGRFSIGYGKLQVADAFVVHFDPQVILSAGVTFGEEDRVLPTIHGGLGVLLHFEHGIQAAIDLLVYVDVEERSRGFVPSIGFAPMLSIGWAFALDGAPSGGGS